MTKAIEAGYYTVPLKGDIKRLPDKTKTVPIFEKGWNTKWTNALNKDTTDVGGIFTGFINKLVAIDCDNQETFDLFIALDPI